jgi:RimJ/RimL family protein N-acetyltransferase
MTWYAGPPLGGATTRLVPPEGRTSAALSGADLTEQQKAWLARALHDESCVYFAVEVGGRHVGQMLLHDADWTERTAMVGYHIFRADDRGRGFGSDALRLLERYCRSDLNLRRLIAITSTDNAASRRVAARAGFVEFGPAREGAHLVVYARNLKG